MHILGLVAAALIFLALQEPPAKPAAFDYSKVDRKIASQPKFVASPRYGLLILGTGRKTRIWMALDKSTAEQGFYDVLYFDCDGDGNLGEEGERFVESRDEHGSLCMKVGRVKIPGSNLVLDNVRFRNYHSEEPPFVSLSFRVNDRVEVYGGYGPDGEHLQFAESPEKAPILHVDPMGPLSFLRVAPAEMRIGRAEPVMIYAGNQGSGAATFLAVDERYLNPLKDKILVTIIAKDREGKEVRQQAQLWEHC